MPALHDGSYFFDESTADGGAGDFYDSTQQAMADTAREKQGIKLNKKQCRFHFFSWFEDSKNETEPEGIVISDELKRYFEELRTDHSIELTERKKAWYALTRDGAMGLGQERGQDKIFTTRDDSAGLYVLGFRDRSSNGDSLCSVYSGEDTYNRLSRGGRSGHNISLQGC